MIKIKLFFAILILLVVTTVDFSFAGQSENKTVTTVNGKVEIYLPREVTVNDGDITLGKVAIIRGQQDLVEQAEKISLGQITSPTQKFVIDRSMIVSRLACSGIDKSKVVFSGAKKIKVEQLHKIIKGSDIVLAARTFLMQNLTDKSICQVNVTRTPNDIVFAEAGKNVEFSTSLKNNGSVNHTKVEVCVVVDGKQVAVSEISFRMKFSCNRVVALTDMEAGTVVTRGNSKIEQVVSDYPQKGGLVEPYGLVTKRRLSAGTVLTGDVVTAVKPQVIIERNQTVVVRLERASLSLTAIGKALQRGRAGDYIRVKVQITNIPRIIVAKVKEDGTVEPVL